MKLMRLKLKNFRQFYGESEMSFATGAGNKNITVIHGENGGGKTSLLNAFKWVLYAETTSGVQLKEKLITNRAIYEACEKSPGSTVDAYVELEFEHDKRRYIIKRQLDGKVNSVPEETRYSEPQVTLQVCDVDGESRFEDRVADVIGRILPLDLHSYFFFDNLSRLNHVFF